MKHDILALKTAAMGRWPELLAEIGGLPREALDGRHDGCPRCGGRDRFRLLDQGTGAVLCNRCFRERNGDGIAALSWARGWGFRETCDALSQHLGLAPIAAARREFVRPRPLAPPPARAPEPPRAEAPTWTRDMARATWAMAEKWARSDDGEVLRRTAPAWRWLASRGLVGALETGHIGVLLGGDPASLPGPARRWLSSGHVVAAPLLDGGGNVGEVAVRTIQAGREPKTLTARGSSLRGLCYASQAGRRLLQGRESDAKAVLLGEGLTDCVALSVTACVPALGARSASDRPESYIGEWARGRLILLAFDADEPGERAAALAGKAVHDRGGVPVRLRPPRPAKDICDLLAERGDVWLAEWIEFSVEQAQRRAAA